MKKGECAHPIRIHGLCACCGEEISKTSEKLFTALHHNSDILVSSTEAERHNEESFRRLTDEKKMVLLLDLDQTIIHTSVTRKFSGYYRELKEMPEKNATEEEKVIREIVEMSVEGFPYYVKKRDMLDWFLKKASEHFEVHIYTMGNKEYGNTVASILDRDRKIFGTRIVTRDDNLGCFEKDLSRIFPTNTKNVIILDDRPDVWGFSRNLLPIRPYVFFRSGDINSPDVLSGRKKGEKEEAEEADRAHVRKEDLLGAILGECVAQMFDEELKRIMCVLLEIHREYFETAEKDVVKILDRKKNVFEGCVARFFSSSFETEQYLSSLFVHHGGAIDVYVSKRTTHVIITEGGIYLGPPPNRTIKYVGAKWMHESIFSLRRLDEEQFACSPSAFAYGVESGTESATESELEGESNDSLYDKIVKETQ